MKGYAQHIAGRKGDITERERGIHGHVPFTRVKRNRGRLPAFATTRKRQVKLS